VTSPARRFVSRGGDKLDGALEAFGIDVTNLRALDAGASTGGFTDCLLRRGAREVVAVDVAYGQLAWELRTDARVAVRERTNVRALDAGVIEGPVDLVVADLAFISLVTVADALIACARENASLVLMVKPQFELPRDRVPRGGVVTDISAWRDACVSVANAYRARGCGVRNAAASRLVGPKGNREFFLHLARGTSGRRARIAFEQDDDLTPETSDEGDGVIDAAVRSAP
jgi:23S rRNA (cytidine1920-2'-O)/16S rRNA (cytidine1409-2'-O)-methyltransferase